MEESCGSALNVYMAVCVIPSPSPLPIRGTSSSSEPETLTIHWLVEYNGPSFHNSVSYFQGFCLSANSAPDTSTRVADGKEGGVGGGALRETTDGVQLVFDKYIKVILPFVPFLSFMSLLPISPNFLFCHHRLPFRFCNLVAALIVASSPPQDPQMNHFFQCRRI